FLAGLSPVEFLGRHWQKKLLLARAALNEYAGAITRDELFELASRDDMESRIVTRTRGELRVSHGPFAASDFKRLPRAGWTLLVQGVDQAHREASRLLQAFAFIGHARLDDVMVSYAAPGGGVGPHFDSYDVFLVQGSGTRRWQVSTQPDLDLVPGAPLKLLRDFKPEREWTLVAGDVLYLPPNCAHDGVALDECITYSVGFRAPGAQELAVSFLEFLEDRLELPGRYADPGLEPTEHPGRIPADMLERISRTLDQLRWQESDVAEFVGRYQTEPKSNVVFRRPRRKLGPARFAQRAAASGVRLAPASRMLFHDARLFMNGEAVEARPRAARVLAKLADARELAPPLALDPQALQLLYDWYSAGYIEVGTNR
ncbi:MAG TPA: cupin domain-containing protein, partial [Burkholderiales bacterium]|nr:cupin domain-containing protein [Burkholderiales bacterium]